MKRPRGGEVRLHAANGIVELDGEVQENTTSVLSKGKFGLAIEKRAARQHGFVGE